jgi:hypothetical protein
VNRFASQAYGVRDPFGGLPIGVEGLHAVKIPADEPAGEPDWNQPALRENSDQFIFSLDRTGYYLLQLDQTVCDTLINRLLNSTLPPAAFYITCLLSNNLPLSRSDNTISNILITNLYWWLPSI